MRTVDFLEHYQTKVFHTFREIEYYAKYRQEKVKGELKEVHDTPKSF